MRHVFAVTCGFCLLAPLYLGGCAVNQAPLAPAPVHAHASGSWVAHGVEIVALGEHGLPVFLVEGRYWHWHGGKWRVWRDIGWQASPPPVALTRMDDATLDGTWLLDDFTPAVQSDDR